MYGGSLLSLQPERPNREFSPAASREATWYEAPSRRLSVAARRRQASHFLLQQRMPSAMRPHGERRSRCYLLHGFIFSSLPPASYVYARKAFSERLLAYASSHIACELPAFFRPLSFLTVPRPPGEDIETPATVAPARGHTPRATLYLCEARCARPVCLIG